MNTADKKRIEDLEKRVRELESRPIFPTIIVQPQPAPAMPYVVPQWPQYQPVWYWDQNTYAPLISTTEIKVS